jgi:hypothetical protein
MANLKIIINGRKRYEYFNTGSLNEFFLKISHHKKIKKNLVYKMSIYAKQLNKYYFIKKNYYVYILDDIVIILERPKQQEIDITLTSPETFKIILKSTDLYLYHFYIFDNYKFEKEDFYVTADPVNYKNHVENLLKKKIYHIDYIKKYTDQYNLRFIKVLITRRKISFLKQILLKFKN